MAKIEGYFEEFDLFDAVCRSFEWKEDTLLVTFGSGVGLGGSKHPLAASFEYGRRCLFIFEGVVESRLVVSQLVAEPNIFNRISIEHPSLPSRKIEKEYREFLLEGEMRSTEIGGSFVWEIVAERFLFDDLKDD